MTEWTDEEYRLARKEHAWLLRAEAMKLHEIGLRLGVGKERVRQMIGSFGRRVRRSFRKSRGMAIQYVYAREAEIRADQEALERKLETWCRTPDSEYMVQRLEAIYDSGRLWDWKEPT